jgi:hypothetical protein
MPLTLSSNRKKRASPQVKDLSVNLCNAALEWEEMLDPPAAGQNVNQAVAAGNAGAVQLNSNHRWKVIGTGNVKIR